MRFGPAVIVVGTLLIGACAAPNDVQSTAASSNGQGEQLPPVDDSSPSTSGSTTLPGTRPVDITSLVLLASDLPGWDVVAPMDVPAEPTWEALDCPDMDHAWSATGRAGTRSRGTNGPASFRNIAVDFATAAEAADVLDAVDRVWSACTLFDSDLGSFWSEPIDMPTSTHRTAGLVVGSTTATTNWTLAYWQIDTRVVILEIEGKEMWTYLNPLLTTLSARLDGMPAPINLAPATTIATAIPEIEEPPDELPVLVPPTQPTVDPGPTTTEAQPDSFPPSDEDWAEHPLAHLAPVPGDLGAGWEYEYGSRTQAEPADPDDLIPGCDAPVPPTLDGYDLEYRNGLIEEELSVMVGTGTAADSQVWIEALRAIAGCDLDEPQFGGTFDLVEGAIGGVDDAVFITGSFDFGGDTSYVQVIGAARVDGIVAAAYFAVADPQGRDAAVARVSDVLESIVAER